MRRFVADREATLDSVLREIFGDPEALAEARVFVDRRRVREARFVVSPGMQITVGAKTNASAAPIELLYDQRGIVAAIKPANLASVPDHHGDDSLQSRLARQLDLDISALHPTSRLDRGVSGVVLFARDERARVTLAALRERGHYVRRYLAIGAQAPEPETGRWEWPIGRAGDRRKRAVNGAQATAASTRYQVAARAAHGALLHLWPETGRTHQLRVHSAHAGAALDGDGDYRGRRRFVDAVGGVHSLDRIALHAAEVELSSLGLRFQAQVPEALVSWWGTLGGEASQID